MSQPSDMVIDVDEIKQRVSSNQQAIDMIGIDLIILAGSTVRGEAKWWSDIDIFLSLPKYTTLTGSDQFVILKEVGRLLYALIDQDNLDINIIEELPIKVKFPIYTEGVILYVRDYDQFIWNRGVIIRDYIDYKIWIDQFYKYQLEAQ